MGGENVIVIEFLGGDRSEGSRRGGISGVSAYGKGGRGVKVLKTRFNDKFGYFKKRGGEGDCGSD